MAAERSSPRPGRLRRIVGTVRFRTTAAATVVVALVLAATATGSVLAQRRALTDSVDDRLRQRAADIARLVAGGTTDEALAVARDDDALAQLVTAGGDVVAASPNIAGESAVAPAPPRDERERFRNMTVPALDDDELRVLSRRIDTPDGRFVLHVAGDLEDVNESVAVLTLTLALAFPAVLAVVATLVWIVVGRALRPVETIRAEVANITAAELDRRVPQPTTQDEIGRLAGTMNAMLDRIEEAHRRQQRFVADASHELRSPLTSIRSELEVDLAHPVAADLATTHHSVLEETIRLQRLVDDLLYLARNDADAVRARWSTVDLDEIVLREAESIRARGTVRVDTRRVSGAQTTGDADQLTRAVRNLLDNAARHAASTVSVGLTETDDEIRLEVGDDGPGIPVDQAERIFQRFARLDDARDRDHGGAGLGLAITHDIVVGHRGSIVLDRSGRDGARFVVRLIPAGRTGRVAPPPAWG